MLTIKQVYLLNYMEIYVGKCCNTGTNNLFYLQFLHRYHKSFLGRDYKAWAQICMFVIAPYLSGEKNAIWFTLSKVTQVLIL